MKGVIKKIRIFVGGLFKPASIAKIDCQSIYERFGSVYGGWDVVVEQLNSQSVLYSFGVGEDATFDLELIERFGLVVHAFDPTPKSITWAKKTINNKSFILHEYGIADFDGDVLFNPPENPAHVSHTILDRPATQENAFKVPVKKLSTIMQELGHTRVDILKMDIEGAEYSVIDQMLLTNIRPKQILIEFHHRFQNVGIKKTRLAIRSLKKIGYRLFSISGSGDEFGFIYQSL